MSQWLDDDDLRRRAAARARGTGHVAHERSADLRLARCVRRHQADCAQLIGTYRMMHGTGLRSIVVPVVVAMRLALCEYLHRTETQSVEFEEAVNEAQHAWPPGSPLPAQSGLAPVALLRARRTASRA